MQTFLPYPDFDASARVLDNKRLGKQRVEVVQIVRGLIVEGHGFRNHPAVLMWKGYEEALGRYGFAMVDVWVEKGFGDTTASTIATDLATIGVSSFRSQAELEKVGALPPWLGREDFHLSHRSALLRKDHAFYAPKFGTVPDDLPYVWPVRSIKQKGRSRNPT